MPNDRGAQETRQLQDDGMPGWLVCHLLVIGLVVGLGVVTVGMYVASHLAVRWVP